MSFVNIPLFFVATVVFICILSGLFSSRFGFSFLLVFLVAGLVAGEDGLLGLRFDDFALSFWVGNVALAVILLDGGLRTSFSTFRTGLRPSLLLATVGVAITAGITGMAAALLLEMDWRHGLLLGAIVGSTDAAAVFSLLRNAGVALNERAASTLEIESGMNDPMAVFLTMSMITVILGASGSGVGTMPDSGAGPGGIVLAFVQQFGLGSIIGIAAGVAISALLNWLPSHDEGLSALLLVAAGLAVFAGTGLLNGSGFLAVYLFGMMVGNRAADRVAPVLPAMDGYAWLSQAAMFLILGLLVTPSSVVPVALPALGVAAVLMLVARPVAVALCIAPMRFKLGEILFIAWVGLRGAVPIVLAVFPLIAGVPQAMVLFNVAFVVVLVSLLVQGTTIGGAARKLGVALPDVQDERLMRSVFGDFVIDGGASMGSLCELYMLPLPCPADTPLAAWMASSLGRGAIVGDRVRLGPATLVVRRMDGAAITGVGLRLA